MDLPADATIKLLTYLLPGFITAAILYNLTPSPRPAPFERVVQALIYTLVVQSAVATLRAGLLWAGHYWSGGQWSTDSQLATSLVVAAFLGVLLSYLSNRDALYSLFRRFGVTCQTSYASEWYGALSQNRGYIVLHLDGSRRLYGWPVEWPSSTSKGHFVLSHACWLGDKNEEIALGAVEKIVISVSDVQMVELMKCPDPAQGGGNSGRPQGTDAATTDKSAAERAG